MPPHPKPAPVRRAVSTVSAHPGHQPAVDPAHPHRRAVVHPVRVVFTDGDDRPVALPQILAALLDRIEALESKAGGTKKP